MMRLDGRRLTRALVVGAVVLLLAGGIGLAVAEGSQGPSADTLQVPAARPGDKATYAGKEVILDPGIAKGQIFLSSATLEWMPERVELDANFTGHLVHPLRAEYVFWAGTPYESHYVREQAYDAATGQPVWEAGNYSSQYMSEQLVLLGMPVSEKPIDYQIRYQEYDGPLGPCGASTPLSGHPYDGQPFTLREKCDTDVGLPTFTYAPVGWEDGPRGRSFRVRAEEDQQFSLWYDSSASLPVHWQSALPDVVYEPYTLGRQFDLQLTSFTHGSGSYTPVTDSAAGAAYGRPPLAPRSPWGPDDSGSGMAFPVSEAYAAAVNESDPVNPAGAFEGETVPQFLASHPDAYLAYGAYELAVDRQGMPHPEWYLIFSDGHDILGKMVEHSPAGTQGVYLPSQTGEIDYVFDWTPSTSLAPADATGWFPPKALLPDQLPLVREAMARYNALHTTGAPANGYGFTYHCQTEGCSEAYSFIDVGFSAFDQPSAVDAALSPVAATSHEEDFVRIGGDGHLMGQQHYLSQGEAAFPIVPSQAGQQSAPSTSGTGHVGFAQVAPKAVAGAGIAALLAGLAYYFWPAAKGAAFGLFSRTEDDKLLQHPRRAQIAQLVEAQPGIHFQDVSRQLGLGRGTLEHHLRKMLDAGLLTKVQSGGYACYFPKGKIDRHLMAAAPVLRSEGGRAVLGAVKQNPGRSSRELATVLGLAPSTVSYHLKKLQEAGLVFGDAAGTRLSALGEQAAAAA